MSNYDIAVGMDNAAFNKGMADLFKDPGNSKYFKDSKEVSVSGVGDVNISWDVKKVPTFALSPPSQDDWNKALDSDGKTNLDAGKKMPTGNLFQVCFPVLDASYTMQGQPNPVGGEAKNVYVYAALTLSSDGNVTCVIEAVKIDESGFKPWDKAIFNNGLLPQIFAAANGMLQNFQLPPLSYDGISIQTPVVQIQGSYLVAAAVLASASKPVDIAGVTWPQKSVFVLLSPALIDQAMAKFTSDLNGKKKSDSGEFKGLAKWNYSVTLKNVSAAAETSDPTKIDLSVSLDVTVGGSLTAAGMALAAAGCAAGGGLLAL